MYFLFLLLSLWILLQFFAWISSFAAQVQEKDICSSPKQIFQYSCVPTSSPCIKGDMVSVQISKEVYLEGLEDCKNHLHGRIVLSTRR